MPRISRIKASFAGARGRCRDKPIHATSAGSGRSRSASVKSYLTVTRGFAAPEARMCYERVESLCHSLNRPLLLYSALTSQWRYSLWTDKLKATMQIAERVYSLAQEQNDARLMMGAYRVLASTLYFLGNFEN